MRSGVSTWWAAVTLLVSSLSAAGAAAAAAAASPDPSVVSGLPELIPLKTLLGPQAYSAPQLSSDGKWLSFTAPDPVHGVDNLWVGPLPSATEAGLQRNVSLVAQLNSPSGGQHFRQVTFDTHRGVHTYGWAEDGSALFFLQDKDGDEQQHLFMVTAESIAGASNSGSLGSSGSRRLEPNKGSSSGSSSSGGSGRPLSLIDLTPFEGVKVTRMFTSHHFPRVLFFDMNKRDATTPDLYRLDLGKRRISLFMINPGGVQNWLFDFDFNVRGVDALNQTDGSSFVLINDALPAIGSHRAAQQQPPPHTRQPVADDEQHMADSKQPPNRRSWDVKELFQAATRDKWGPAQWIAASDSGEDVATWRRLATWPAEDEGEVLRFNKAGDGLYVFGTRNNSGTELGDDTTDLWLISTAPGAAPLKLLAEDIYSDASLVVFSPHTWEPQLVMFDYSRPHYSVLDSNIEGSAWRKLQGFVPGAVGSLASRTSTALNRTWLVRYSADNATTRYYVHAPDSGTGWPPQLLFDEQPALARYKLANQHPVVFNARDGLQLPGYISLPVRPGVPRVMPQCVTGVLPDVWPADTRANASAPLKCPLGLKLPMVLLVHGGPWSRDRWGYQPVVQMLTNRGYAVLQVNFRGSKGFGKNFVNAGNREWGGKMQDDLTDAVRWAVEKGIADPQRVCIMGGSYGGYASLAGLAYTPSLYKCGVDLVGIANIGTFLRSMPPHYHVIQADLELRVGRLDDEAQLRRISPVFAVDKIRAPLLMAQGARDPRVPKSESDQMYQAMKAHGLDVTYVVYPDEGHGLVREANRLDFYHRVGQHLAKHLGGEQSPRRACPAPARRC